MLCNTRMTAVKVEWLTNGKKCFFTVSCVCNDESVTENSWYVGLAPEMENRLFVMFYLLPRQSVSKGRSLTKKFVVVYTKLNLSLLAPVDSVICF